MPLPLQDPPHTQESQRTPHHHVFRNKTSSSTPHHPHPTPDYLNFNSFLPRKSPHPNPPPTSPSSNSEPRNGMGTDAQYSICARLTSVVVPEEHSDAQRVQYVHTYIHTLQAFAKSPRFAESSGEEMPDAPRAGQRKRKRERAFW